MFRMVTTVPRMATPEYLSRTLAGVVDQARKDAGVTQRDLSDATGIPLVTLNRRLTGSSPFLFTELVAVARHLGLSVTELALRTEQAATPVPA